MSAHLPFALLLDAFALVPFLFLFGVLLLVIVSTLSFQHELESLAREWGWEGVEFSFLLQGVEGTWRGRKVALFRDQRQHRIAVTVDVRSPIRFAVLRRRFINIDIGGPPVIQVDGLTAFKVRAMSPDVPLLRDPELQHVLNEARYLDELRANTRIEVTAWVDMLRRSEAARQAWSVAQVAAEKLTAL